MTIERPLLLVIGMGSDAYRGYLLRAVSRRFDIHMLLATEPSWGQEYLHGWSVLPSTEDPEGVVAEALSINQRRRISGVAGWDERRIFAASHAARALGLRNGDPDTIMRMRDKGLTRAALDAAGVPQPRSRAVRTIEEAEAAAADFGFPVVVKPRDLGASLGVVRVDDPTKLADTFTFTWNARGPEAPPLGPEGSILIEECVVGEEISVDSVVQDGVLTPLFVARKVLGFPPYAEEVGHFVHGDDPLLADRAIPDLLQATHTALGFRDGCTHTEIMLTAAGPRIIEVNGRLGGDVIPYLGGLATGIDAGVVSASAACGLPVEVTRTADRVAGVRFFYPEREDTTVAAVGFHTENLPQPIDRLVPIARPGVVVSPPPKGTWWGRVAYATAVAATKDECAQALAAAEAALEIVDADSAIESAVA